jgi:hypothetical protein
LIDNGVKPVSPPDEQTRLSAISLLLQEVGTELRSRREPEHLYTAALVGALGAVAWGAATIATVQNVETIPFWKHPAIVGAFACVVIAVAVWIKVRKEHKGYVELRGEHIRLAGLFATQAGLEQDQLPAGLRTGTVSGNGHVYSGIVIFASAIASFAFCIAVWAAR